jgi:hypothetical protein
MDASNKAYSGIQFLGGFSLGFNNKRKELVRLETIRNDLAVRTVRSSQPQLFSLKYFGAWFDRAGHVLPEHFLYRTRNNGFM